MLADAELVAFLPTADPERAREFYEGRLSLPLLERTPFALVFRAPNAVLRVTVVEQPVAAPYTVLGWVVPDIALAARDLVAQGIEPRRYPSLSQSELGVWCAPSGAQLVWFSDPDGNVLSLTQL